MRIIKFFGFLGYLVRVFGIIDRCEKQYFENVHKESHTTISLRLGLVEVFELANLFINLCARNLEVIRVRVHFLVFLSPKHGRLNLYTELAFRCFRTLDYNKLLLDKHV